MINTFYNIHNDIFKTFRLIIICYVYFYHEHRSTVNCYKQKFIELTVLLIIK